MNEFIILRTITNIFLITNPPPSALDPMRIEKPDNFLQKIYLFRALGKKKIMLNVWTRQRYRHVNHITFPKDRSQR